MYTCKLSVISSVISGLTEVSITHPIDVWKINYQLQKPTTFKTCYEGFLPRIVGVVPMRLLFWTSRDAGYELFKESKYKHFLAGAFTGTIQTTMDHPVEIVKTRLVTLNRPDLKQAKKIKIVSIDLIKQRIFFNGCVANIYRNVLFAGIFNTVVNRLKNDDDTYPVQFGKAAASGFTASFLSHPFDYLKTIGQANTEKSYLLTDIKRTIKTPSLFMKGVVHRSSISFIGMGIGFTVYDRLCRFFKSRGEENT